MAVRVTAVVVFRFALTLVFFDHFAIAAIAALLKLLLLLLVVGDGGGCSCNS